VLLCILSATFVVIIPQSYILAQLSDGGYAESWLSRNVGARPVAFAGAYSAIVNDPSGIFYNPAGAAFMEEFPTFNSTVSTLGLDRTSATLCWAQQIIPSFGLGAGISNLYSGTFTSRNKFGEPIKDVNNNQISAMVVASYRLEFLSMGAGFKYISNSLNGANVSASGVTFDLGAKLNVLDLFTFGLAMNNIGGKMKWNTPSQPSDKIPYTIRTGIATEFGLNEETKYERPDITGKIDTIIIPSSRYIMVGLDAVMNQFDKSPSIIVAAEIIPIEIIALRGGISLYGDNAGTPEILPMNNWGAGVSLRPQVSTEFIMNVDYSVSSDYFNDNRITHHISLQFEL
jgi:hypothetical protein